MDPALAIASTIEREADDTPGSLLRRCWEISVVPGAKIRAAQGTYNQLDTSATAKVKTYPTAKALRYRVLHDDPTGL